MNPFPIILSAPSGGGKTTIARELLSRRTDLGYSVSCTTRAPRSGEEHGRDYYFLSITEFLRERERNQFAEAAADIGPGFDFEHALACSCTGRNHDREARWLLALGVARQPRERQQRRCAART